jgi:hypothetical protein
VLAVVMVSVGNFVFNPWSMYFGGRLHLVPSWAGIGRMRSSAGDYVLYLTLAPARRGAPFYLPSVNGFGYLCTPRGERHVLRLSGSFQDKSIGADSNGKDLHLFLHRRPYFAISTWDARPRLELRGRFNNPNLELDDGESVSRAFLPDGTLYTGPARNQPHERERLTVVLHEAPWSSWLSDCRATP